MRFVFMWSGLLCLMLLAVSPGEGPGIQEHQERFQEAIKDRLQYYWIAFKTAYSWVSWYIEEHDDEIYDMIDWSMDFIFDEKIREQGINPAILEELRQKRLNKFGEFLVIVVMIAVCLKMIRNATKRTFYEELKFRQRERERKEFLRGREKNLSGNWNDIIATSHTKGVGRGRGQRKYH